MFAHVTVGKSSWWSALTKMARMSVQSADNRVRSAGIFFFNHSHSPNRMLQIPLNPNVLIKYSVFFFFIILFRLFLIPPTPKNWRGRKHKMTIRAADKMDDCKYYLSTRHLETCMDCSATGWWFYLVIDIIISWRKWKYITNFKFQNSYMCYNGNILYFSRCHTAKRKQNN